jgi:hypothetical protein
LILFTAEAAFARRRGGHGDGGHDDLSSLVDNPYLRAIFLCVLACIAACILWAIVKRLRRNSTQSRARVEAAKRRSQNRLARRSR